VADETYRIIYVVDPAKALKGLADIDAQAVKTMATLTKLGSVLKTVGQNPAGLRVYGGDIKKIQAALKALTATATAAGAPLKAVGTGNRGIGELTGKVKALAGEVKALAAAAAIATPAVAGIGAGVKLPKSGAAGGVGAAGAGAGSGTGGGSLLAYTAIGMGSRAVRSAGKVFAEAEKDHREFLAESAAKSAEFRESLREYASLRSAPGPHNGIVREATKFAKEAGVLPEEIAPFLTNYEGSAATGRMLGNIGGEVGKAGFTKEKQAELEAQLKVVGAQFATRTGLDARTAGDLTGVVSTYKKLNSHVDLAGQLGGMHYGLDQGRGEITPLARGELGQAGSEIKSGRVSGLPELGAFIGVASVASKTAASAGTTYGQASRFLNESGEGNEDQKAFIKESGMGAAKGNFAKLKALRDYLEKVKPEDANTFLESKGYGNSTDRRSVLGMVGNVDVLEKRIAESQRIAANGKETLDKNAANQRQMASVNRRAEATGFTGEIEIGVMAEKLAQGKEFARGRLMDQNQRGGQQLKAKGLGAMADALYYVYKFGGETGEEQRINAETVTALIKGGKAVGVDVLAKFPGLGKNMGVDGQGPEKFTYDYGQAAYAVEQAGGDPFGGAPGEAAKALRTAADKLDKLKAGNGAPQWSGGDGRAAPPQAGNGGAGVNPGRR
jgi:hypothetical protein